MWIAPLHPSHRFFCCRFAAVLVCLCLAQALAGGQMASMTAKQAQIIICCILCPDVSTLVLISPKDTVPEVSWFVQL